MVDEEIRLYASHHQVYVQDSEPRGTSDGPGFWTEEAGRNKLAIADGLLGVGTGSYDYVKVRMEQHDSEPPVDLSNWDHVTVAGLEVRTNFVLVMGVCPQAGCSSAWSPATSGSGAFTPTWLRRPIRPAMPVTGTWYSFGPPLQPRCKS